MTHVEDGPEPATSDESQAELPVDVDRSTTIEVDEGETAIVLSEEQAERFDKLYRQTTEGYGSLDMDRGEFVEWCLEQLDVMVVR